MKILKENSSIEKALQEVEAVLEKHGLVLIGGAYLCLTRKSDNQTFELMDIENTREPRRTTELPRAFDTERIVIDE